MVYLLFFLDNFIINFKNPQYYNDIYKGVFLMIKYTWKQYSGYIEIEGQRKATLQKP